MDLIKAQLDRLQKQLSGLTASQRMLTAALAAIMVITFAYWGHYAGEAEMEPVLNQSFSQEDITRITTDLTAKGIHYSVVGDRILVPTERKLEVIAALSYGKLLPHDTKLGFDEMIKQNNALWSESMNDRVFNHAKETVLGQIIRNFPNVADADVIIDPKSERHVEGSVEPCATVTITMQSGQKAGQQIVDAAADVVQGAQSGLSRSKIKVVVGGAPRRVTDVSSEDNLDSLAGDQIEIAQRAEVKNANKIRELFAYIPDLKVSVTVKVNSTTIQEQSKTYDQKNVVQKELQTESETEETSTPAASSGEPGLVPNGSLVLPGNAPAASAAGPSNTREKTNTKFDVRVPETMQTKKTPAGAITVVAATVRVPVSYFAAIYARQNPSAKDATPTEAELKPLIENELPKMKTDVMKCTALASEKDVAVETYTDAMPVVASAPQPATASVTLFMNGHGKDLVLGALAVMSLFMVSMMVRKAPPMLPVPAVAVAVGGPTTLTSGESFAGEASVSGGALDGMELDEEAVRSQQMVDQVSTMVKENPDAAATLVKRWLNRS